MANNSKQSVYSMRYDAKNTIKYYLKLNKKTDNDLIAQLNKHKNKQGYLKELINKDIKSGR